MSAARAVKLSPPEGERPGPHEAPGARQRPLGLAGPARAVMERRPWAPPPVPRCASSVPEHYAKGREASLELRRALLEENYERLDFHGQGGDVEGLRAFLAHKFGSSVRGWRQAIARDKVGLGRVTFQDFCAGMKRIGYSGHAMSLWRALSNGNKKVALWDFEPDLASQMDECAQGLVDCFPQCGTLDAWKVFPRKHAGRATFEEFQSFMLDTEEREILQEDNGVDLRRVFEVLDMSGRGTVSREDFHFFDHWARQHLGLYLHEEEVQAPVEEEPWSPPPRQRSPEQGLEDFRRFCIKRFGSPGRAWRVALDMKGCGSLSAGELGQGCRGMGWKHSHALLYRQLCREGHGLATMRALDPESAQAVDEFGRAICAKFDGDMYAFWSEYLDSGDSGTAKKSVFVSACMEELGVQAASAKKLFNLLDTAGTGWIAVTELDFVDSFECALITEQVPETPLEGQTGSHFMSTSSSAPTLYAGGPGNDDVSTVSSWDSIRDGLWSPAKSTRAMQYRCLAQSTMLKKRWLKDAVLDHCLQQADKNREPLKSTTLREKSELCHSSYRDIFRTSHGFYLEGVKRMRALAEPADGTEPDRFR